MKISPALLLLKASEAAVNYAVTSCNDEDKMPQLSFEMSEDFYNKWHFDESDMVADGHGFLTKTIPAADLSFQVNDDDYWSLSYSMTSAAQVVGPVMLAKEFTIDLNCKYPRMLSTAGNATVTHPDFGPGTAVGEYEFIATVADSEVGERTEVTISPRHSLPQIRASVKECEVSFGDHKIYPIHSMHDSGETCTDSRLNTVLEYEFSATAPMQTINFSYNSFLFVNDENSDQQELTLTCQLHVFGEDGYAVPASSDCGCYTEDECSTRFCIRVVSDSTWSEHALGAEIKLLVNDIETDIALNQEAQDQTTCLEINYDDQVTLQQSGDDGVYIKEIWVNDELTSISPFWIDGDNDVCEGAESFNLGMMSTQSITLSKTGELIRFHHNVGCCEHVMYTPVCDENVILDIPQEISIAHSNLVADGFDVPETFELSFDMKLTLPGDGQWLSIIRVGRGADIDFLTCGDRYPAMWIKHSTASTLHINSCVGGDPNHPFEGFDATIDQWQNVQIGYRQEATPMPSPDHTYYIKIDGVEQYSINQPSRYGTKQEMKLWVGGPFKSPATGSVRNIRLIRNPSIYD